MANLFSNMKTEGLEQSEDRLGGFQAFESDIYTGPIKNFFAGESRNGAVSVTLILDAGGGKEYRETLYITNKSKENFFKDKTSGKKMPLPGFTVVNDICLLATGKELSELDTEDKVVNVWDPDAKKEVPKSVPVITECLGQKIAIGVLKQLENKNEKDSSGNYVPTAETRETNVIDKVFHPDLHLTVAEARAGKTKLEEAAFWDSWLKRNQGQTRDKRELKDGDAGGAKGKGPATPPKAGPGNTTAPRKSLFGK